MSRSDRRPEGAVSRPSHRPVSKWKPWHKWTLGVIGALFALVVLIGSCAPPSPGAAVRQQGQEQAQPEDQNKTGCEAAGGYWSPVREVCTLDHTCPEGERWNPRAPAEGNYTFPVDSGACWEEDTDQCPGQEDWIYDNQACETPPGCPKGQEWNGDLDLCVAVVSEESPSGGGDVDIDGHHNGRDGDLTGGYCRHKWWC